MLANDSFQIPEAVAHLLRYSLRYDLKTARQRNSVIYDWLFSFKALKIVQAKSELGTTKRRNLSHVFFLDQNFMRNKNILGKKLKS